MLPPPLRYALLCHAAPCSMHTRRYVRPYYLFACRLLTRFHHLLELLSFTVRNIYGLGETFRRPTDFTRLCSTMSDRVAAELLHRVLIYSTGICCRQHITPYRDRNRAYRERSFEPPSMEKLPLRVDIILPRRRHYYVIASITRHVIIHTLPPLPRRHRD